MFYGWFNSFYGCQDLCLVVTVQSIEKRGKLLFNTYKKNRINNISKLRIRFYFLSFLIFLQFSNFNIQEERMKWWSYLSWILLYGHFFIHIFMLKSCVLRYLISLKQIYSCFPRRKWKKLRKKTLLDILNDVFGTHLYTILTPEND